MENRGDEEPKKDTEGFMLSRNTVFRQLYDELQRTGLITLFLHSFSSKVGPLETLLERCTSPRIQPSGHPLPRSPQRLLSQSKTVTVHKEEETKSLCGPALPGSREIDVQGDEGEKNDERKRTEPQDTADPKRAAVTPDHHRGTNTATDTPC